MTNTESAKTGTSALSVDAQDPAAPVSPVTVTSKGFGGRAWKGLASVVGVLVILQILGVVHAFGKVNFPLPSAVFARLGSDALTGPFWLDIGQTLLQAIAGLVIGSVVAIPIGLVLGRFQMAERAVRPVIEFLRAVPSVAILPLVILTLGVGPNGAILLSGISSLWLVLVLTTRGARATDPVAHQTMVAFGVPRLAQFWRLILPSAAPFIVTGVRIAASVSLIVSVTTELLAGMPGIGKAVSVSMQGGDNVGMFSYLVAAGLLGLLLNSVLVPIENRLLSWHPSRRELQQ